MTTIVTALQLKPALLRCIEHNIPVYVEGKPGIGKSSIYKQIAKELDIGFIDFRATTRDITDLMGVPFPDPKSNTTRWRVPHELPNEERHGKRGIFLLDEMGQANETMQKGLFSLVLDGFVGEYRKPEGWFVAGAGNRTMDRSGVSRMNVALGSRFMQFELTEDLDAWLDWATRAKLNPLVIAFLRFRQKFLHIMPEGTEKAFPNPRAWERVALIADEKDENLRHLMVQGLVGEAAATEFEAFVRIWSRVPSVDAILRDPKSVHVPDMGEPALLYAVATAVAKRVSRPNMHNALAYARRLPKEFEIMLATDAVRREPGLKETKAFGDWYAGNQGVLV